MRRLPLPRALLATLVALSVAGAAYVLRAGSSHASPGGVIVFASDRLKYEPGEIYSLSPGSAPRDVSRSLAADYGLAVAPKGDLIAFWSGRSGSDQIYLARGDGSHLRRVHQVGGDVVAQDGNGGPLAFTADGTRLFASDDGGSFVINTRTAIAHGFPVCGRGVIAPAPDGRLIACGVNNRTVVYDLAGKARFSLRGKHPIWSSRGWLTNESDQALASARVFDASGRSVGRVHGQPVGWSPDGRYLLFTRGHSLRVSVSANLAKSRRLVATLGGPVSFTPDGRSVSTANAGGHPVLVPLAGGPATPGLDGGGGVWSRDGRVAYANPVAQPPSHPGGKITISVYITDTHGRNPRVAGRFPFNFSPSHRQLIWLPGRQRVLYTTESSCSGSGLFAVSATGGAVRPLTSDQRDLELPVWSPDGKRIAYTAQLFNCNTSGQPPVHLETVRSNGTGAHAVTTAAGDASVDYWPSFDPNGRRIAFLHADASRGSLETVAVAGGARTFVLPPGRGYRGTPVWSPDGSEIAFVSGGGSIWTVAATGGKPERVATIPRADEGPCGGLGLAWSPDGKQFAAGGAAGVYLITPGKRASTTPAIRAACAEYPAFSPDGKQIAFDAQPANALGGQTAIMVANVDGSGLRTLSTVPFRQSVHPSWQPA